MATVDTGLKASWRRRERWRRLGNLAGLAGALVVALIIGLATWDDLRLGLNPGPELVLFGTVLIAVGYLLPRYAVQSLWQRRVRAGRSER